jgi:hypothetical protein
MALSVHALQVRQVRLKSVSNQGHFTHEAERVFRLYLPSHWSGVTEIRHMVFPAHVLLAVQVRLKSVSNEGHITLQAGRIFLPYLPLACSGVTKNATWHSLRIRYAQCKLGWSWKVMKGTSILRPKQFFVRISHRIALRWLKEAAWHSICMRYMQCQLGWNR